MLGFVVAVVLLNHLHSDFFFMLISKDSNIFFLKKSSEKRGREGEIFYDTWDLEHVWSSLWFKEMSGFRFVFPKVLARCPNIISRVTHLCNHYEILFQ